MKGKQCGCVHEKGAPPRYRWWLVAPPCQHRALFFSSIAPCSTTPCPSLTTDILDYRQSGAHSRQQTIDLLLSNSQWRKLQTGLHSAGPCQQNKAKARMPKQQPSLVVCALKQRKVKLYTRMCSIHPSIFHGRHLSKACYEWRYWFENVSLTCPFLTSGL